MRKLLKILAVCCIILGAFVSIITFSKNIIRMFLPNISLNCNHEDVAYILVGSKGRFRPQREYGVFDVRIDDREDIEKIINFLNSLKLIEEVTPYYKDMSINGLIKRGWFTLSINFKEEVFESLELEFELNYLIISHDGHEWDYSEYYIKNSGYNHITKNSKTYQFLYDLINK